MTLQSKIIIKPKIRIAFANQLSPKLAPLHPTKESAIRAIKEHKFSDIFGYRCYEDANWSFKLGISIAFPFDGFDFQSDKWFSMHQGTIDFNKTGNLFQIGKIISREDVENSYYPGTLNYPLNYLMTKAEDKAIRYPNGLIEMWGPNPIILDKDLNQIYPVLTKGDKAYMDMFFDLFEKHPSYQLARIQKAQSR